MPKEQKFEIGYHLNTWDFEGRPEEGFPFLAEVGFVWYEALIFNSLSDYFARRFMTLQDSGPPAMLTDTDFLRRMHLYNKAQEEYGLRLASLYANCEYTNAELWPYERDCVMAVTRFLQSFGSKILVCGGGPPVGVKPQTDADFRSFANALEELGAFSNKLGIRTVYHPHLDCFIETREQLDRFMAIVDTDLVGLCIDPAHLVIKDADPVDIMRVYMEHIDYIHFKDAKDFEGLEGYARYLSFCELGAGVVDFPAMVEIMLESDYDGLALIELDASHKTAEESCLESIDYVVKDLGLQLNIA